ncbi:hypothetical protein D5086_022641 [Populus alba]|uniref:Uncharacterized protein n=1 Tax=Populus alba TaxID=43335 RepID=A0ACC4BFK2_POPAL
MSLSSTQFNGHCKATSETFDSEIREVEDNPPFHFRYNLQQYCVNRRSFCWTGSCAAIVANQHRAKYQPRKIRYGMIFFLQARNSHEMDRVAPIAPSPSIINHAMPSIQP